MADLPIEPDYSSPVSFQPRVLAAGFGDGYQQRTADGINSNMEAWELSYDDLTDDEVGELLAFFSGLNAVDNFSWQSKYSSSAKQYVCPKWGAVPTGQDSNQLTASIQQVPEA